MADRPQPHQIQVRPAQSRFDQVGDYKGMQVHQQQRGPSTGKILAVVTLLPVGGTLLGLAGLTLMATIIGLLCAAPVFLIFSPVLVPAAIAIGLAVTAFITSGAFGLTGLSSLSWVTNHLRRATGGVPEQLDSAKRRMADMGEYFGQKTKEVGQDIQHKAQETKRTTGYEPGRESR
ncbi:oleosin Ara h 10.0102 [Rosa rugosa]|uniref:oleosin Ara h 10.0102 n=1 Tax=Rosa rugosa TaxID=74645 RepID=UPI002B40E9E6|nr:oleosin Ara h 10.0102 [Rosa rugosa]